MTMMPFEERWGLKAVEILREWFAAQSIAAGREPNETRAAAALALTEGTLAWKIACGLQAAYDLGGTDQVKHRVDAQWRR